MRPTVHFIYTVPRGSVAYRALGRLLTSVGLPPLHRLGIDVLIPWKRPIRAPHSISFHLLHALQKRYRVRFYSIYEHTVAPVRSGDLVLAQPAPVTTDNPPRQIDKEAVTHRTFYEHPEVKKIIIMPYSGDSLYTAWWKDLVRDHGANCIFLCGKIWIDRWNLSPFKGLSIKRLLRLNMCIDQDEYPLVKSSFNSKGKRGYLYIGHVSWYKNTSQLERIAEAMPEYTFGHIGGGHIRGWEKISEFADLTPQFMAKIAEVYDVFVNCSTADPQATTILEQMCFGFAVACTPESGYTYDSVIPLSTTDTIFNVKQLLKLQNLDQEILLEWSKKNREYARLFHHWEAFSKEIMKYIYETRTKS